MAKRSVTFLYSSLQVRHRHFCSLSCSFYPFTGGCFLMPGCDVQDKWRLIFLRVVYGNGLFPSV